MGRLTNIREMKRIRGQSLTKDIFVNIDKKYEVDQLFSPYLKVLDLSRASVKHQMSRPELSLFCSQSCMTLNIILSTNICSYTICTLNEK